MLLKNENERNFLIGEETYAVLKRVEGNEDREYNEYILKKKCDETFYNLRILKKQK